MKNMKAILTETALVGGAIAFWTVALPAALVAFPALALWEKTAAALARGNVNLAGPRPSPITV